MERRTFRQSLIAQPRPFGHNIGEPEPPVAWIRYPIQQPADRLLHVLFYARYSTDEQNPRSIDAQIAYCERLLRALGITAYERMVMQDVEMSGELRHRPGINQVWSGIDAGRFDLILVEDASRLYRHDSWAVDLVYLAVDKQMRVICINDSVDTADDQRVWIPRLKDATRAHAQSNQHTSDRIKRAQEYLWGLGAALGCLRAGYRRKPTTPATERETAKGPYFDEIDDKWAPDIRAAFEQIANQDPPWKVARYLTEKNLPKAANAKLAEWTEENVKSLIRETLYRGVDTFRVTVSKKRLSTGQRKAQPADPSQILMREMSHLRIVSDELWHQANAAIDDRRPFRDFPSGPDNPLFGTPRDSRSLLTTLFKCGICGAPMHKGGRGGRAYVCSSAQNRKCWNRATAEYELIEDSTKRVVREQLCCVDIVVDDFLRRLALLTGDADELRGRVDGLTKERKQFKLRIQRLIATIENAKSPSEKILQRIDKLEGLLRKATEKRSRLERLLKGTMIPTRDDIMRRLRDVIAQLDGDQKTAGVALRKVIRRIDAIPLRQFNSTAVVLRGRIVVDVARLLSVELAAVLSELHGQGIEKEFAPTTETVDLFRPSTGPAYGLKAEALERERNLQLDDVAKALGLTTRRAHIALQYGRALRQAGLDDPFIELTAPPARAAHWGPHKKSQLPLNTSTHSVGPGRSATAS